MPTILEDYQNKYLVKSDSNIIKCLQHKYQKICICLCLCDYLCVRESLTERDRERSQSDANEPMI